MPQKLIFAFDIGTGSIGECVRKGNEILHLNSLLLPADFASIEDRAKRRRQYRTRLAHKARETWWKQEAEKAGLEVPETRQTLINGPDKSAYVPDKRMLREFPAAGDNTIYTSSLLRIALLQGEKL